MVAARQPLADRIGPKTLAGVLVSLIASAAIGAVALRDLVTIASVHVADLQKRADDVEERLRWQEHRPLPDGPIDRRLSDIATTCRVVETATAEHARRIAVIERDLQHALKEQEPDRLCARVGACREGR